jgi:hypothetical protein
MYKINVAKIKRFVSRDAEYPLDPSRIFEIVSDLYTLMRSEEYRQKKENLEQVPIITDKPRIGFYGNKRHLRISCDSINISDCLSGDEILFNETGELSRFELAKLKLSDDGNEMTMTTYAHDFVRFNTEALKYIGLRYGLNHR